jgi:serine/threonine-protein kinase
MTARNRSDLVSDSVEHVPAGYRFGDWEVTEPIGAGGWGTVYEGRYTGPPERGAEPEHDGTGTGAAVAVSDPIPERVALKFLPTADLAPRQARRLLETARREIELGRRAHHPRLIRLLDSVVVSEPESPTLDGAVVLIMERAEYSLRQLLDAVAGPGAAPAPPAPEVPPLTDDEGARVLAEICEGLAHLHGLGWVHGDLKPDNVLMMADGSVRLSDFGLAVELEGTHAYIPPVGTPDYLPPERWNAPLGEQGVTIRPSTDIWAFGLVIHQVFAKGALPFPGATPMARGAAVQEYADRRVPPRMDYALPPFWRELAADCLAPTHEERARHTAESLLTRIRAEQDRLARSAPSDHLERTRAVRRRGLLAIAATAAACTATAVGWSYATGDDDIRANQDGGDRAVAQVTVYNAEKSCRNREDRHRLCSLGLAIDPTKPYRAGNVVTTRVWHGDHLGVDCRITDGVPVTDEIGTRSTQWFRIRLPTGSGSRIAWLAAVRTKDRPAVPECSGTPSAA